MSFAFLYPYLPRWSEDGRMEERDQGASPHSLLVILVNKSICPSGAARGGRPSLVPRLSHNPFANHCAAQNTLAPVLTTATATATATRGITNSVRKVPDLGPG
jgi:hypothetical protein